MELYVQIVSRLSSATFHIWQNNYPEYLKMPSISQDIRLQLPQQVLWNIQRSLLKESLYVFQTDTRVSSCDYLRFEGKCDETRDRVGWMWRTRPRLRRASRCTHYTRFCQRPPRLISSPRSRWRNGSLIVNYPTSVRCPIWSVAVRVACDGPHPLNMLWAVTTQLTTGDASNLRDPVSPLTVPNTILRRKFSVALWLLLVAPEIWIFLQVEYEYSLSIFVTKTCMSRKWQSELRNSSFLKFSFWVWAKLWSCWHDAQ